MSWLFLKPSAQPRAGLIFRIFPRARPVSPSPRPEARAGSPCPLPPVTAAACSLPPCLRDTGAGIAGLKREPPTMATSALPRRMSLAARSTWSRPSPPHGSGCAGGSPCLPARGPRSPVPAPPASPPLLRLPRCGRPGEACDKHPSQSTPPASASRLSRPASYVLCNSFSSRKV